VEGQIIMDWLSAKKEATNLRKTDLIAICTSLLSKQLLIKEGKEKESQTDTKFNPNMKYRLMISHKRLLEAKVRHLSSNLVLPKNVSGKELMDFPVTMFAKQFTFFEWMLFKKVELREVNHWLKGNKDQRDTLAPNLLNLTNFVNRVSQWIATEIVTCANVKRRQSLVKKYINIASHCFAIKNYGGVLEIVLGLKHAAIERMKLTWKIPQKYLLTLKAMAAVVSPENNWEHWRKLVKEERGPYVPYIGLLLSDLTFIKDGGGDNVEVPPQFGFHFGWIKIRRMGDILLTLAMLQSQELEEEILPDLTYQQYFAQELYALSETELWKKSRQLEPATKRVTILTDDTKQFFDK